MHADHYINLLKNPLYTKSPGIYRGFFLQELKCSYVYHYGKMFNKIKVSA